MAEVALNRVIGGSEIWQRWYYPMSLFRTVHRDNSMVPVSGRVPENLRIILFHMFVPRQAVGLVSATLNKKRAKPQKARLQ